MECLASKGKGKKNPVVPSGFHEKTGGFQISLHGWKETMPEKTLFRGSLVTFLTNELGTQCPCLALTGKT